MSYDFCTLFDANYLPRGLALYRSLIDTCEDFRLRVFCMDEQTRDILERLDLPGLEPIALAELEQHDRRLASVKSTRSQVEYCWTATPAICLYCLEREPQLEAITYLDADLMFFREPSPIFEELGTASVLITPHRYAPRWESRAEIYGIYNVQFVTFRPTADGLTALHWWHDRCIAWCYSDPEDGKLGDQKYLDDWPDRFAGVHVLEHPGGGLAPWNVERYELRESNGSVLVDRAPLIFYHYHSLRLYHPAPGGMPSPHGYRVTRSRPRLVWTTEYPISQTEDRVIWEPYVRRLTAAVADVRRVDPTASCGIARLPGQVIARGVARAVLPRRLRRLVRLLIQLGPDSIPAIGLHRHRGSWRNPAVARQMAQLAVRQLESAETVPPYRAFLETIDALISDFPLPAPARLLDVGCGTGHYGELLERAFPGRFLYTGYDDSPELIETGRRLWPERELVIGDVLDRGLDLGGYDVVLASALIDILPEYERALDILLGCDAPYLLLHRQRIIEGRSHVEIAPGYTGQKTYRVFLNLDDLRPMAMRHGREIARSLHVEGEIYSFLLVRS